MSAAAGVAASAVSTAPAWVEVALSPPPGVPPWILWMTLLPLALVATTAFARISIALAFFRHGLGAPDVPSGMLVTVLTTLLTVVAMAPVLVEAEGRSLAPYRAGEIAPEVALARLEAPLRGFMRAQTRSKDLATMRGLVGERVGRAAAPAPEVAYEVPAFVLSELKSGFQIGLVLWLPFLVVDVLVAGLLSMLGLSLDPRRIALPLKLLLFVAVDGWTLLTRGLVRSFVVAP